MTSGPLTPANWRMPPQSTLHGLLGIIAAEPADQPLTRLRPQFRGGLPPRVLQRVRDYVETHLEDSISLQDLASTAGLSTSHFIRAFKQSEGMTPHRYLLHRRVRRALDLDDPDMTLAADADILVGGAHEFPPRAISER